jgi:hypothetical protein
MTQRVTRSLWTAFTATVVGFTALLVGCASFGPLKPVQVSEIKSVAGTWKGTVYEAGSQPDNITLTIQEDGSYEVVSRQPIGETRGKGQIVISQGRLILQGPRGRGVGTLLSTGNGDRVMRIEATLSDNRILTAELGPSR